jgi:hypothetical protein
MKLTMGDYVARYMGDMKLEFVRVFHDGELEYYNIYHLPEEYRGDILTYPIGKVDIEGNNIYQGDILEVTIKTKYDDILRQAVVRTDGFMCCGLDYFDDSGLITEEGDFIDEFFIESLRIIGNVFEGVKT